jgi:hypothetical protein
LFDTSRSSRYHGYHWRWCGINSSFSSFSSFSFPAVKCDLTVAALFTTTAILFALVIKQATSWQRIITQKHLFLADSHCFALLLLLSVELALIVRFDVRQNDLALEFEAKRLPVDVGCVWTITVKIGGDRNGRSRREE